MSIKRIEIHCDDGFVTKIIVSQEMTIQQIIQNVLNIRHEIVDDNPRKISAALELNENEKFHISLEVKVGDLISLVEGDQKTMIIDLFGFGEKAAGLLHSNSKTSLAKETSKESDKEPTDQPKPVSAPIPAISKPAAKRAGVANKKPVAPKTASEKKVPVVKVAATTAKSQSMIQKPQLPPPVLSSASSSSSSSSSGSSSSGSKSRSSWSSSSYYSSSHSSNSSTSSKSSKASNVQANQPVAVKTTALSVSSLSRSGSSSSVSSSSSSSSSGSSSGSSSSVSSNSTVCSSSAISSSSSSLGSQSDREPVAKPNETAAPAPAPAPAPLPLLPPPGESLTQSISPIEVPSSIAPTPHLLSLQDDSFSRDEPAARPLSQFSGRIPAATSSPPPLPTAALPASQSARPSNKLAQLAAAIVKNYPLPTSDDSSSDSDDDSDDEEEKKKKEEEESTKSLPHKSAAAPGRGQEQRPVSSDEISSVSSAEPSPVLNVAQVPPSQQTQATGGTLKRKRIVDDALQVLKKGKQTHVTANPKSHGNSSSNNNQQRKQPVASSPFALSASPQPCRGLAHNNQSKLSQSQSSSGNNNHKNDPNLFRYQLDDTQ